MATEEDRQDERDRLGNDPSAPRRDDPTEEIPVESPAEGEDADTAAHELQEREELEPERQEQREAEEHGLARAR